MKLDALRIGEALIKRHEGFRDTVYLDTMGIPTVGWGHAFFRNEAKPGDIFPIAALGLFLQDDLHTAVKDFEKLELEFLDGPRQAVILDMLFNLGLTKLKKFKKFLECLRNRDYPGAVREMKDSQWAAQVGTRAVDDAHIMLTGDAVQVFGRAV